MAKYRKKPVIIEAIQWTGTNADEIKSFIDPDKCHILNTGDIVVSTLEGPRIPSINDFIVKGVEGEFYPCKPSIFNLSHELVED